MRPRRFQRLQNVLDRRQPDLTVLMDRVNKPHNFSAVLRTCDAVGVLDVHVVPPVHGLKLSHDMSAGTGKWMVVHRHQDGASAARRLRERGYRIVAADPGETSVDFREVDYTVPTAVLLGAELFGVSPEAMAEADLLEPPPRSEGHIIIAGFGRFGQIVARVLRAKRVSITALDISPEQIEVVERFGGRVFYGDASRRDVLEAAQADKARAFVLAIDAVEASVRTAAAVRAHYPALPVYARARNRNHVHRLMDLGVTVIRREAFLSAIDLTHAVLRGLGHSERDVRFAIETFKEHDERRLVDDYRHFTDIEKLQDRARSDAANLEKLFDEDAREQASLAAARLKERAT